MLEVPCFWLELTSLVAQKFGCVTSTKFSFSALYHILMGFLAKFHSKITLYPFNYTFCTFSDNFGDFNRNFKIFHPNFYRFRRRCENFPELRWISRAIQRPCMWWENSLSFPFSFSLNNFFFCIHKTVYLFYLFFFQLTALSIKF